MTLFTVPWDKMSGADFGRLVLGITNEQVERRRQGDIAACIEAIRIDFTYGFPASLVDECKAIIAERERIPLVEVEHLGPGRIAA